MARVTIVRNWGADDQLRITVEADNSYPDALDQARATAHREFAEALPLVLDNEAES